MRDWAYAIISIGQMVFDVVFALLLRKSGWKHDDSEALKTSYQEATDKLHETTARLVDERFRAMTHSVTNHVQALVTTMDLVNRRLDAGEGKFTGIGERHHSMELKWTNSLQEVTNWVRDSAASKQDLKEHETAVAQEFRQQNQTLAKVGEALARIEEFNRLTANRGKNANN